MDERTLRRLALLSSVAGLLLLFLVSQWIDAVTDIRDITRADTGTILKVCGEIASTRVSNNHVFLTVDDGTDAIRFVIFNSSTEDLEERGIDSLSFAAGGQLCARGEVAEYPKGSGRLELIYQSSDLTYDP